MILFYIEPVEKTVKKIVEKWLSFYNNITKSDFKNNNQPINIVYKLIKTLRFLHHKPNPPDSLNILPAARLTQFCSEMANMGFQRTLCTVGSVLTYPV